MAPPTRPNTADWSMDQMTSWLQGLDATAVEKFGDRAAYVHPLPISWATAKQKNEWEGYQEDNDRRDFISKLEKVGHHGAKVWLAMCDTPNESYVGITLTEEDREAGVKQWDKVGWHAWGLAVVATSRKQGSGRVAFIFDCDQELPSEGEKFHIRNLRTGTEREFMRVVKQWNVKKVFIGNAGKENAEKGECLSLTTEWVERMAQVEGAAFEDGKERFSGFVEIGLST